MGQLLAIAIKHQKRGAMQLLQRAQVTTTAGVENDFRGKPGERQVTVLTDKGWRAACKEIAEELPWPTRRANLYIGGLDLYASTGLQLHIGSLRLLITRETDPCHRMQEAHPGLFQALTKDWRGGVCCQVIQNGAIAVGDTVSIVDAS